jgi:hypothetical protein
VALETTIIVKEALTILSLEGSLLGYVEFVFCILFYNIAGINLLFVHFRRSTQEIGDDLERTQLLDPSDLEIGCSNVGWRGEPCELLDHHVPMIVEHLAAWIWSRTKRIC